MDARPPAPLAVEPTRLPRRAYLLATLAYLASVAAAHAAGMRMQIWWALVQLLDPVELEARPWRSFLYLHSQPPVLNALAVLILRAARWTSSEAQTVAAVAFFALGLLAVLLVFHLAWRVSESRLWAGLACGLLLIDPGFHFYRQLLHYSLPLLCLVLLALAAAERYWSEGSTLALTVAVTALCGLTLTSSLYHPLWTASACTLIPFLRRRLPGDAKAWRAVAVLTLGLLVPWPLKNLSLFGQAVNTSWSGYNLTRGTPIVDSDLQTYLESGVVADAWISSPLAVRLGAATRLPVLSAPSKSSGVRNWNHYGFLISNRELARRAMAWRFHHLRAWARTSLVNYLLWGRPTYVDSYWGVARGPETAAYAAWTLWHHRLLYPNLRALVERIAGPLARLRVTVWGGPAPYSALSVIVLPLLVGGSSCLIVRAARRGLFGPADALALMALWILLWTLVAPCLTDGFEGNRMRFPSSPTLLLLAGYILRTLTSRTSAPCSAGPASS